MKRYGDLFERAFSYDNLYLAFLDARKGKRDKRHCFEFESNLGRHLSEIRDELHGGTYHPRPYNQFEVFEPKRRIIFAPAFRDTVVQHAIYRTVNDIFDRSFVSTSFACRKGYGTHRAADYIYRSITRCSPHSYYLQLDVKKFFYNIDYSILRSLIERKIKDDRLVRIMLMFAKHEGGPGIPIGNLLSQLYALIYLNPLDQWIKRDLKVQFYARYVDDFVLIGLSRDKYLALRGQIALFLWNTLRLELSKSTIQCVGRGINFCGYRTWQNRRLIRKHSLFRFRRLVRSGKLEGVVSLLGHAKKTDSLTYMLNFIKEQSSEIHKALPKSYRQVHNAHAGRA